MYNWRKVATYCQENYGVAVDWEEGFFICVECGEPIYEEDFNDDLALQMGYCPVCGEPLMDTCELLNWYTDEEEYDEDEDEDEDNDS